MPRQQHHMVLAGRTESGAEEWNCPECGRRMLLRWPPNFESLVLDVGDASAQHTGAKGGVLMGRAHVASAPSTEVPDEEQQWLRRNGIDWDGLAS
jgi:hypothetical protein